MRAFDNFKDARTSVYDDVLNAAKSIKPVEFGGRKLELVDAYYDPKDDDNDESEKFTPAAQANAIYEQRTLGRRLLGQFRMTDLTTGDVKEMPTTLAIVPRVNDDGPIIYRGSRYSLINQQRLKAGVYARVKKNQEVEAYVNADKQTGLTHRVIFRPDKSMFYLNIGNSHVPLASLLRTMGTTDKEMQEAWGDEIARANISKIDDKHISTIYDRLVRSKDRVQNADIDTKRKIIAQAVSSIGIDRWTTNKSLGIDTDKLSPQVLVKATQKALDMVRGSKQGDDRDSFSNQTVKGPEDYFAERIALDSGFDQRNAFRKALAKGSLDLIPRKLLQRQLEEVIFGSGVAVQPDNANPLQAWDLATRITKMGDGAIGSSAAVPMESRDFHASHIGFIDSSRTVESLKVGVDLNLAANAVKGRDGKVYAPLINRKTGQIEYKSAEDVSELTIAPQMHEDIPGYVVGIRNGEEDYFKPEEIEYVVPDPESAFSGVANLIPAKLSQPQNRTAMGARFITQSIPLKNPEAPLVQAAVPGTNRSMSFNTLYNKRVGVVSSAADGVVKAVAPDRIVVTHTDEQGQNYDKVYHLHNGTPLGPKTALSNRSVVKPGDSISKNTVLATSNFANDKGEIAIGANAKMALMPWKDNYEDAYVVSDSFAKRMASVQQYSFRNKFDSKAVTSVGKFSSILPSEYSKQQLSKLDENGVIRVGERLQSGDPIILSAGTKSANMSKPLSKTGHRAYVNNSQVWEHDDEGVVSAIHKDKRGNVFVSVKTESPMVDGDKCCYSWDTEVLTSDGWIQITDLTCDHEVATLLDGSRFEYVNPSYVHAYAHTGVMYHVKSTQIDVCVTDNHKLYVKPRSASKLALGDSSNANSVDGFSLIKASDLYGSRYRMKRDGVWVGEDLKTVKFESEVHNFGFRKLSSGLQRAFRVRPEFEISAVAFAGILGAFLAEGSVIDNKGAGTYAVVISQKKPENRARFAEFLDLHRVKYSLNSDGFLIYGKQWLQRFKQLAQRSHEKFIPEYVFKWSVELQRVLFYWMMWGDGNEAVTSQHYYTSSKRLADDMQRLLLHIGCSGTITWRAGGEHVIKGVKTFCQPGYVVSILRKKNNPTINHGHVKTQNAQVEEWMAYDGFVYCPTMPVGNVIYVRRDGKPCWCGNSEFFGSKGVVRVIPDDEMLHDSDGKPFDIVGSDLGVISRQNSSRAIAMLLGKVAQKTGQPYLIDESDPNVDLRKVAREELGKHGLTDTEVVVDPKNGRKIPGVLVGPQYIMKLTHLAESKAHARSTGVYTSEETPAKGSEEGMQAKRISNQELGALMAHGAMNYLQETAIKGSRNDEYVARYMTGKDLPTPKVPFVYNKFLAYMQGMAVNPIQTGTKTRLSLMTDVDVDRTAGSRKLQSGETVNLSKDMKPIPGGLFDPAVFGDDGRRFAKYELSAPIPHPMMQKPLMKIMGLTEQQFRDTVAGKHTIQGYGTGTEAIYNWLKNLDVDKAKAEARQKIKTGARTTKDKAVQVLQYLTSIDKHGIKPESLMLTKIPIVPPVYRPVSKLDGNNVPLIDGLNLLYQQMVHADKNVRQIKKFSTNDGVERLALYDTVRAVTGLEEPADPELRQKAVKGIMRRIVGGSPKTSYVQQKLLSGTIDHVARAVVVPSSDLKLDEIGLPEGQAWEIYKLPVLRSMARRGIPIERAKSEIEKKSPMARQALLAEMDDKPVTASRAPVLHKYGMLGFRAKLVPGHTLQMNPLVHAGYNLDHDGDARFTKVLIAIKITGEDEKSKEKALANFPLQVRLSGISLLSTQTQEKLMASFTRASLPVLRGYSVLPIDLADFPRLDRSNISKGRCGDIHWYKVPEDVRVLALNRETGQPEWAEVSRWTVHHGCEVELVTLANGACIFTDDDPRGVLGVVPGESLKVVTATPTDAQAKGMLVPRAVYYGGVEETAEVMEIPQFYNSDVDKSRTHKLATEIELDAEFGWLIGAHVADGWSQFDAERSTGVCFAKSHAPTRDKWQQQVSRFLIRVPHFGSRARTKEDAQKSGEAFGGTVASVLSAGCLGRLFVDMFGHGAGNKYLPDFATCGPRPFRAAIICGLLDTDATVAYNQSKAKKNPQLQVWYNTTSLRLARDIVLVAASVGVQAKVRFSKVTDAGNAAWEVSFRSGDIQDLVTEFPDVMVNDERRLLILNAIIDRESSSYQRLSRVPITYELAASLRKKLGMPKDRSRVDADHSTLYSALQSAAKSGYMSQAAARLTSTRIGDDYIRSLPDGELFIQYRDNDAVTWEYIESVEKTGKVETGYDLTVLGYENWMDTSGVFGPNTMNFHAVITPEAAEEVKKKMFPSKNLFAASDFKTPMAVPRQDHALGLWLASTAKSKDAKPVAFRTIADATKAFARNEINIDTPVTILEQ